MPSQLYLLHATYLEGFISIVKDGALMSPRVKNIHTTSHNPDVIFFTPTFGKGIPVPLYTPQSIVLHFSNNILRDARFFANEGNAYDMQYGAPDRRGQCECKRSFINFPTNAQKGACYIPTFRQFLREMTYSFEHCDGGPEVGVIANAIPLTQLEYVTMPLRDYHALPEDVKAAFALSEQPMVNSKPFVKLRFINHSPKFRGGAGHTYNRRSSRRARRSLRKSVRRLHKSIRRMRRRLR